jgi:hypothetical protein
MNIELHIEELVLRGMGGGMQHEIRAAMEGELARLCGGTEVASLSGRKGSVYRLDGGALKVKSGDNGQVIGARLAQSVYREILK